MWGVPALVFTGSVVKLGEWKSGLGRDVGRRNAKWASGEIPGFKRRQKNQKIELL